MASRNDATGDLIQSKTNSDKYRDNWDKIFGKKPIVEDLPIAEVDVSLHSHFIKKLNIKCEYFDTEAEIFKSITGISFDDIEYVDDLIIYSLIFSISCADEQDPIDFLEHARTMVLYYLQTTKHEAFDNFYYQLLKDKNHEQ